MSPGPIYPIVDDEMERLAMESARGEVTWFGSNGEVLGTTPITPDDVESMRALRNPNSPSLEISRQMWYRDQRLAPKRRECPSWCEGLQCRLPDGHDGWHEVRWYEQDAERAIVWPRSDHDGPDDIASLPTRL